MNVQRKHKERRIGTCTLQAKNYHLGKKLGTSQSNPFGCPSCVRSTKWGSYTIEIFEHGVRFRCGCIVSLPPMHDGRGKACLVCHPVNVLPFKRRAA